MPQERRAGDIGAGAASSADAQGAGAFSTAVQLLRHSLDVLLAKDIEAWAALCDANVVVEFPFAPDVASRRTVGRSVIYDYMKEFTRPLELHTVRAMRIHATADPRIAIAEWSVAGQVIGNGNPYEMSHATFATFENGLIVRYREYWNPCALIAALDGTMF